MGSEIFSQEKPIRNPLTSIFPSNNVEKDEKKVSITISPNRDDEWNTGEENIDEGML